MLKEGWRKDLRICLSMIICQRLFVVHYSLPPLLVLSHFHPLDLPWLSPSTVTTSDRAMLFSADCCPSKHRLRSLVLTESGHLFLWPCLIALLSTSCIFSLFIFLSSLVPSFFLWITAPLLTNTHRRTPTLCLPLLVLSGHCRLTPCCRGDCVCGNLSQEILVLHTFPFACFCERDTNVLLPQEVLRAPLGLTVHTHTHCS